MKLFKRRINLIIGKKHIILASLALLLGIAVYANFALSSNPNDLKNTDTLTNDDTYGAAQFVGKTDDGAADVEKEVEKYGEEFFAQARLDNQKSRDEAIDVLKSIYNGGDLTQDQLEVAAQDAVDLSGLIESEARVENLLKAQGFEEVLCYFNGKSANIIVKTAGLDSAQAAQIKNTLLSEIEIEAENINIVEVP